MHPNNYKFLFIVVVSFGTISVIADSTVADHSVPKTMDLKPNLTIVTQDPNLKETDSSTTESLKILTAESAATSINKQNVPVANNSLNVQNVTERGPLVNISASAPLTTTTAKTSSLPVNVNSMPTLPSRQYDINILRGASSSNSSKWIIRDPATNMTCIIAQMSMQLNVTYPCKDNKLENATMNFPTEKTKVNGSCSNSSQSMIIQWSQGHSLQINFAVNESAKDFYVSGFTLNVNASVFKNVDVTNLTYQSHEPEFATPLDMSYKCNKMQKVNLTSPGTNLPAVLTLKDTQIQAYVNSSKTEFGAAQDCDFFDTPDIVPIAVGCALAILVLVVLVAYLIGRKRSQNRGYLSM